MRGKNIVVVGMGNSAMDIASELSQRPIARNLWVSARRGVWVLPKYMNGRPADKSALPAWMPRSIGQALARKAIKKAIGRMEDYGLPKPDHEPLEAHPSVSGEFLTRAGCGDVKFKPAIKALEGPHVRFADDSVEQVDAIIFATGYDMKFPFFEEAALKPDAEHRFPLYKRMMKAGVDNLFFMGLAQPLPTLVNFAEQQSKLAAAYLTGRYRPPAQAEMETITAQDEAFYLGPYYKAARHTIQVDFNHYVTDLKKELTRGEARARAAGYSLPVKARARSAGSEAVRTPAEA
jgi:cation diffusion facilitator CzcD-associated flavoprotein CzcO